MIICKLCKKDFKLKRDWSTWSETCPHCKNVIDFYEIRTIKVYIYLSGALCGGIGHIFIQYLLTTRLILSISNGLSIPPFIPALIVGVIAFFMLVYISLFPALSLLMRWIYNKQKG